MVSPTQFVPFTGSGNNLGDGNTTEQTKALPPTNCCWSCLTGIWNAFVGLLTRIHNCVSRFLYHTPSEVSPTTPPLQLYTLRPVDENEILTPPLVQLFWKAVAKKNGADPKTIIIQQGLQFFGCLSASEQYWMLKKLVLDSSIPLSDYFPEFLKKMNANLHQNKIYRAIVKTFMEQRGSTVANTLFIARWLSGEDKSVDAHAGAAVVAVFTDKGIRTELTPQAIISEESAFVQKIVEGAFSGHALDTILHKNKGLADFKQLTDKKKLMSLESLIGIAGSKQQELLQPGLIINLFNALPQEIKKKIADDMQGNRRQALFVHNKYDLSLNLTMETIQSAIYPIIRKN